MAACKTFYGFRTDRCHLGRREELFSRSACPRVMYFYVIKHKRISTANGHTYASISRFFRVVFYCNFFHFFCVVDLSLVRSLDKSHIRPDVDTDTTNIYIYIYILYTYKSNVKRMIHRFGTGDHRHPFEQSRPNRFWLEGNA